MPGFQTSAFSPIQLGRTLARLLCCFAVTVSYTSAAAQVSEPIAPIPLVVVSDIPKFDLGKQLFQDKRLSLAKDRSCSTCHPLDSNGMDGLRRAKANGDVRILRNTPSIFNVGFNLFYNWDGKFETLPALDNFVLQDQALMGNNWPQILATLRADPVYLAHFASIYAEGITKTSVLDALNFFQGNLTTPNSRFDKYLRGDAKALSESELRGYRLFKSYGCVSCHQGVNVGGNLFQKFGVFPPPHFKLPPGEPIDAGRFSITQDERDRGVFRVPSLRNVAVTGPYFHGGRATKLEDAVDTMARVQLGRTLSKEEIHLIVQFLGTLTGEYMGHPLEPRIKGSP